MRQVPSPHHSQFGFCVYFSPYSQARAISLKSLPMSLVMQGGNGKSFVMNLMDTPGGQLPVLVHPCA